MSNEQYGAHEFRFNVFNEENKENLLRNTVERALAAPHLAPNATLKVPQTETHHGRETNTVLQNLTDQPSAGNGELGHSR